eukprot:COSAG06_NODE_1682_length_8731_cov_5.569045_2_plen_163_part_00
MTLAGEPRLDAVGLMDGCRLWLERISARFLAPVVACASSGSSGQQRRCRVFGGRRSRRGTKAQIYCTTASNTTTLAYYSLRQSISVGPDFEVTKYTHCCGAYEVRARFGIGESRSSTVSLTDPSGICTEILGSFSPGTFALTRVTITASRCPCAAPIPAYCT